MHPRRSAPALVILLVSALPLMAASAEVTWRDLIRDVYLDGALDRRAQVLVSSETPSRVAVLSERLPRLVVLDPGSGNAYEAPKSALALSEDRLTAALEEARFRKAGTFTSTDDGIHQARLGRRALVVKPHVSTAGPMAVDDLLRDYPVWAAIADRYEADPAAVAELAAVETPTTFRIVFATWCGDSRNHVPRALAAIEAAANPNLRVELVGIGPRFQSPLRFVAENRIINVPTILVERGPAEIGRMTETPATETVEGDLASIVAGSPPPHPGRWERAELLASGVYRLRDADGSEGTERWRIFATPSGGKLVHSVVTRGDREREIWQRFDAAGKTELVEVTDRTPAETRRTRYFRGAEELRAHSRSNRGGITDQILPIPSDCGFATGSVVAAAWACEGLERGEGERVATVYAIGDDPSCVTGALESVRVVEGAGAPIAVGGEARAVRHRVETGERGEIAEAWIDAELGIPVRRLDGRGEAVLIELETAS